MLFAPDSDKSKLRPLQEERPYTEALHVSTPTIFLQDQVGARAPFQPPTLDFIEAMQDVYKGNNAHWLHESWSLKQTGIISIFPLDRERNLQFPSRDPMYIMIVVGDTPFSRRATTDSP